MTKRELSQLYYLNREIEQETKRLLEFKDEKAKITGLPYIDKMADTSLNAQIKDCETIIQAKRMATIAEYNRLVRYIAGIDDSLIRQILTLRYINGFNWVQVSIHIGGGNTADGVRKIHDRFLQNQKAGN